MRKKRGVDKKKLLAFGLAVVTIVVCLIVYLVGTAKEAAPEESPLNVAFIDVGQGDCELLRCEDTVVLIEPSIAISSRTPIPIISARRRT